MAGLLDFIQALREGADWAKRDIQKIGADPVASAKGAGTGFVKGVSTDLLGMPVDTGVNLYNLGKAGVGTVGGLFGMRPENLPVLTEKKDVPGSSEWLEEQVRKRGGGQFIDAPAGSSEIASLLGNVVAPGPKGAKSPKLEVMTYHGTPHTVPKYDLSKIGTGEGAQAYGHGMYFAEAPSVAKTYQGKVSAMQGSGTPVIDGRPINWDSPIETAAFELSRHNGDRKAAADFYESTFKKSEVPSILRSDKPLPKVDLPGNLYKQDLPDEVLPRMLQWDKPLSEQPEAVRKGLTKIARSDEQLLGRFQELARANATGDQAYGLLTEHAVRQQKYDAMKKGLAEDQARPSLEFGQAIATQRLKDAGIPGLSYFDQGSRTVSKGTRNHVIWDQSLLDRMLPQRVE